MQKSPFPGMDPYLEDRWPEVHASLIVYSRNRINQQLPNDLQANIEENLAVYEEDDERRSIRPDVNVSDTDSLGISSTLTSTITNSPSIASEPELVKRVPHPTRHIEIVSAAGKIITAIEFISPWNKVGNRARDQYLQKQMDYLDAGVNLVEIDLVRQGRYVLAAELSETDRINRPPYMICVYRDIRPERFEIYRVPLTEQLPNISIPLRPRETDVILELQPLIDACYRDGRYFRINYQADPKAKFNETDTAWIISRLQELGRR